MLRNVGIWRHLEGAGSIPHRPLTVTKTTPGGILPGGKTPSSKNPVNEQELERLVVRLTGDASGYKRMLREASDGTKITADRLQIASQRVNAFGLRVRGFGAEAATAILPLIGITSSLGTAWRAINLAAEAEKTQAAFGVMLQSAEKGAQLTRDLQQFAAETPLNTSDIQRATRLLLQFGTAGEDVIPTLRTIGDVTGGDAQRMMQMALAFGQASASGRLMGQDLLQMINAGFNPLQEISRKTGKSIIELKKEMEKGHISIEMIRDAFKSATSAGGQFHNNMQTASKTLSGLYSTMQDDIDAVLRSIGTDLVEALHLKDAVKAVSGAAQAVGGWFNGMNDSAKTVVASVATLGGSLVVLSATWSLIGPLVVGTVTNLVQLSGSMVGAASAGWNLVRASGAVALGMRQTIGVTSAAAVAMRQYTVAAAAAASAGGAAGVSGFVSPATLSLASKEMGKFSTATLAARIGAGAMTTAVATLAVAGLGQLIFWLGGGTAAVEQFNKAMKEGREVEGKSIDAFKKTLSAGSFDNATSSVHGLEKALNEAQARADAMDTTWHQIARNVPLAGAGLSAEIQMANQQVEDLRRRLEAAKQVKETLIKTKEGTTIPAEFVHSIDELNKKLEEQAATVGMSSEEVAIYRLRQRELYSVMTNNKFALADQNRKFLETVRENHRVNESVKQVTKSFEEQIATFGKMEGEAAIIRATMEGAAGPDFERLKIVAARLDALRKEKDAVKDIKKELEQVRDVRLGSVLVGSSADRELLREYTQAVALSVRGGPASPGSNRDILQDIRDNTRGLGEKSVMIFDAGIS